MVGAYEASAAKWLVCETKALGRRFENQREPIVFTTSRLNSDFFARQKLLREHFILFSNRKFF